MATPRSTAFQRLWYLDINLVRAILNIIAMLLISLSCVPCRAETPSSINVGVLASLTDEWAAFGDNIVKGARLAAQELNQSGGVRGSMLNLVVEDTREANSGAQAVTAYRSLRLREVQYFIGPTGTPAGLALAPILRRDSPVIVVTPSVGVRDFSDSGPNVFNTRGVDEASSKLTARYFPGAGLHAFSL